MPRAFATVLQLAAAATFDSAAPVVTRTGDFHLHVFYLREFHDEVRLDVLGGDVADSAPRTRPAEFDDDFSRLRVGLAHGAVAAVHLDNRHLTDHPRLDTLFQALRLVAHITTVRDPRIRMERFSPRIDGREKGCRGRS